MQTLVELLTCPHFFHNKLLIYYLPRRNTLVIFNKLVKISVGFYTDMWAVGVLAYVL